MGHQQLNIFSAFIRRLLNPKHLYNVIRLQRNRKKTQRVYDDAQLKLYHQIMPGDFLHYGFFENPAIDTAEISLKQFYRAQLQYAENILQHVQHTHQPMLDIGCGMGGMLRLMNEKKWNAIGLTPDINQAKYIKETYPNKMLESKFEDLDAANYAQHFGTVFTSESLQYLQLQKALPLINQILKADGHWIACDYFRIGEASEKSGHDLASFLQLLDEHQFKITFQQNITPHILPTIGFVHLWATQIVMPLLNFGEQKMLVKAPGIHYALQNMLPIIKQKIDKNIAIVDPEIFAKQKQYILMVIEKK
jgi:cyclopropane fatty-acyl-phospholipid synthase-like methyltransferase